MLPVLFLLAAPAFSAGMWPLERLYQRPYAWGTSPSAITWPRTGQRLVFLWNEQGNRFLDLYSYDTVTRRRARLTSLESASDEFWKTGADKDELRRLQQMPEAGVGAFALTDDGARAAFAYKGDLFVVSTLGGSNPVRLTRTKAAESAPRFSPDGRKLASVRGGQVVVQDLGSGQLWQVTDVEPPWSLAGYFWSRDGKRICYVTQRTGARRMPLPNYSGRLVAAEMFRRSVAGDEPVETAIHVIGAEGERPVKVEMGALGGKVFLDSPQWSPDSTRIAFQAADRYSLRQQVLVADASTGKSKAIVDETDKAWVFSSEFGWSPDSQWLWFTSERDGWAHLYKVAAEGGDPVQLTRGAFEVRGERFTHPPQWTADGWLYFSSTENGPEQRHFYRIRPDGSGKQQLSSGVGIHDGLVSEDGGMTAWLHADLRTPFDLWVGGDRVTTSPRPEFGELPWAESRFVSFPSRVDRKTVHAKLLLPPGYDPAVKAGRKWPCVFFIHGAGYATSVLAQWGSYHDLRFVYNNYLASKGYVVMDVDYRGSSGYGRDWRVGVSQHMGGADLEDVLGAADYLASLGNIDMSRLGVWGVSYGGFLTNMAMFLSPDTFRAGSSWAAVNDWENYNAWYSGQRLRSPGTHPEAYRRSSPVLFSRHLKNHLLIVHGMVDNNVLFQDSVQLTEKLIQEGKDFSHIYYPQESHGFVRDESWVDALRRTTEWFDRWLQ